MGAKFLLSAALVMGLCFSARAEAAPCTQSSRPHIAVSAAKHRHHLCEGKVSQADYLVSLGTGGMGKKKQGDNRTPLGKYLLGKPRPSNSGFHLFVPVGYPTKSQKKKGYTGGAIGIHGPPSYLPQTVVNLARGTDWTEGCLLVFTNKEIEEISRWVRKKQRQGTLWIVIEEG